MSWAVVLGFVERAAPVLFAAGLIQGIIAWTKRKPEVAILDATAGRTKGEADALVVTSAEKSVQMAMDMVARLESELAQRAEEARLLAIDASSTRRRLATSEADQAVLKHQVVGLEEDLRRAEGAVRLCQTQIEALNRTITSLRGP